MPPEVPTKTGHNVKQAIEDHNLGFHNQARRRVGHELGNLAALELFVQDRLAVPTKPHFIGHLLLAGSKPIVVIFMEDGTFASSG